MKNYFRKKWFWLMISFIIIFLAIQFVRKPLDNPPVTGYIQAPDSIQRVLIRACFDCHSNITRLSWYDKIAPASWVVEDHVREGRSVLNFSEWDSLTKDQQKVALFESFNQMEFKVMPLEQYTFVHPAAKISMQEIEIFRRYVKTLVSPLLPDTAKRRLANEQYNLWISGHAVPEIVRPAPNGIIYNPDYKNWVAISSTERFDNGTMRVIVGNDIAVKAAKKGDTQPWPDGSVIVKILWISNMDSSGIIQPGALRQLDFMIKDREKYESTSGWGFARWIGGLELKPYGKNALFSSECVRCHMSMRQNDFVFTDPIELKGEHDLENKVIGSFIDWNNRTMSTLYGNTGATEFIRKHTDFKYPAGSELTLVTWKQKEDDHWFGARIPSERRMIEKVYIKDSLNGKFNYQYTRFTSASWGKISDQTPAEKESRIEYIVSQRASVMP